jgi:putative RNA 2'-phosphotransferase
MNLILQQRGGDQREVSIKSSGLLPMGRQYVHLSVDEATAFDVGRRKARKPTILRVSAGKARNTGIHFYEGNEKVWLADFVPPDFIVFGE